MECLKFAHAKRVGGGHKKSWTGRKQGPKKRKLTPKIILTIKQNQGHSDRIKAPSKFHELKYNP